jgi:hypothetical protein
MNSFDHHWPALKAVPIDPANKYVAEFTALPGDRVENAKAVMEYMLEPDYYVQLSTGIPAIDGFFPDLFKANEYADVARQGQPQLDMYEFAAIANLAASAAGKIDLAEITGNEMLHTALIKFYEGEEHPAIRLSKHLQERYENLLACMLQDRFAGMEGSADALVDEVFEDISGSITNRLACYPIITLDDVLKGPLDHDDPMVQAYRSAAPSPEKLNELVACVTKFGRDWQHGGAPCPVESYRKATIEEIGLPPDDYEALEFTLFIMQAVGDELAQKFFESTITEHQLQVLKYGRKGHDYYQEFCSGNCPGCIVSPSQCDFMTAHRDEVAQGKYLLAKCTSRYNGTISIHNGRVQREDLSDSNRFDPGELEMFGFR